MQRTNVRHRTTGFAHSLLIAVIAIVLATVFFCGWWVWQGDKDKLTEPMPASTPQTEQNEVAQEQPQSVASEKGKYLVIKEWGVKVPLNPEIARVYYVFETQGKVEYARIYDAALEEDKNADGEFCDGRNAYDFYLIGRKAKDVGEAEFDFMQYKEFPFSQEFVFGGLAAHQSINPCSALDSGQVDDRIEELTQVKKEAMRTAFNGIQKE